MRMDSLINDSDRQHIKQKIEHMIKINADMEKFKKYVFETLSETEHEEYMRMFAKILWYDYKKLNYIQSINHVIFVW